MKLAAFLVLSLCSAAAFGNAIRPADIEANFVDDIERLEASLKAYEEDVNLIVTDIEEQVDRSVVEAIQKAQKITEAINLSLTVVLNSKKCTLQVVDDIKEVVTEIFANVDSCKQNALTEAIALAKEISDTFVEAYTDVSNLKSKYDKCNAITNQQRKTACMTSLAAQAKLTTNKTEKNANQLVNDTKQNGPAIVTNAKKCGVQTKETAEQALEYADAKFKTCLTS